MTWELYRKNEKYENFIGVRVSTYTSTFTKTLFELMGQPKKVSIWVDKENKAIAFIPSDNEGFSVQPHVRNFSAKIQRLIPKGRYIFQTQDKEKFICVLEGADRFLLSHILSGQ